ncbi:MAG: hypothetical protein PHP13_07185 [Methanomicrobium sp.]|nr:hypothetical protein [Methanomicrobium sp.]MDD4299594.1 hypothetical protein [Methanomicrobium sp.]
MPRENIITGGLEGDGVEGYKKKEKDSHPSSDINNSKKHGEKEDGNEFSSFIESDAPKSSFKKASINRSSSLKTDIFETEFASPHSSKGYRGDSSIGSSSDIFSNGFGSKDAGWMSGRKGKSPEKHHEVPYEERKPQPQDKKETGDIFETGIARNPLESGDSGSNPGRYDNEAAKVEKDPFYTGFGYTDQRDKKSQSPGSAQGRVLGKESSPKRKEKEEPKKSASFDDEDDLFS